MPAGYSEYVRRLGGGALGNWVRVYAPADLATRTGEWRERVQEYWFWDTSAAGIEPQVFQQQGVVLADTFDGDELCFLPEDPEALSCCPATTTTLLPRDDDEARARPEPGVCCPALDVARAGEATLQPVGGGRGPSRPSPTIDREAEDGTGEARRPRSRRVAERPRRGRRPGQPARATSSSWRARRTTFFLPAPREAASAIYQLATTTRPARTGPEPRPRADPAVVSSVLAVLGA